MTTSEECPGCGSAEHKGDECPFDRARPAVLGVPNATLTMAGFPGTETDPADDNYDGAGSE